MNRKNKEFDEITKRLEKYLPYKNQHNPQLVITFAGIPSSGKTEIAKKLEKRYKAIRINGDLIYDLAKELGLASDYWDLEKIKCNYVLAFLVNNPFRNKLIILDKGMDRMYEEFFALCKKNKLRYFLIQLNLSKADAINRIKKRDPKNWRSWLAKLDRWIKENNNFKKISKANLVFDANNVNLRRIYLEVERILKNAA